MQHLYLLFLLAYSATLTAQTYQPIIADGRSWFSYESIVGGCPNAPLRLTDRDTTLEGETYRVLESAWEEVNTNFYPIYLVRADTNHSKLYYRFYPPVISTSQQGEFLAMDLSLQIGDTFTHPFLRTAANNDPVFTVDSVGVVAGRKVITLSEIQSGFANYYGSDISHRLRFVEGVGPSHWEGAFVCNSSLNDELVYSADIFGPVVTNCTPADCTTAIQGRIPLSLSLLPNPTTGILILTLPIASVLRIELRSVTGILLRNQKYTTSKQHHFDFGDLPSGLYLLTAITSDGRQRTERVVLR